MPRPGPATPLIAVAQESGVGRWHTVRLATLSFFEYLQIKKIPTPNLPAVSSLTKLFDWRQVDRDLVGEESRPLVGQDGSGGTPGTPGIGRVL